MADIGTLWVGDPLTKIEHMCLASFVKHGHTIVLFVYDKELVVPDGVIKEDANDILAEDQIFKIDDSYGPFADLFRYKMIQKTGLIWSDTDNICLRPDWDFPLYVFGEQGGQESLFANGLLKAPSDSNLINDLVKISDEYDKGQITWGEIGPQLLTRLVKKYFLTCFKKPITTFYPVHFWEWEQLWLSDFTENVLERCKDSYTLQIWNQMLSKGNYNKNDLPKGSVVDHFYRIYT